MNDIKIGTMVDIYKGDELIRGLVKEIYPRKRKDEVKVSIHTGDVGYVYKVVTKHEIKQERFKFYNLFFYSKHLLTIANKNNQKVLIDSLFYQSTGKTEETAYLFSNEEDAKAFLSERGDSIYAYKRISKKKYIIDNFKKENIDYFYLNNQRKISANRLNEYEKKFRAMG